MKSRISISITAVALGLLVFFLAHLVPQFEAFDLACIRLFSAGDDMVYRQERPTGLISINSLEQASQTEHSFYVVGLTDDPDRIFESSPPSPLDYAVILDSLIKRHQKRVIMTTQLVWDDSSDMEIMALNSKLAQFEQAIVALPVTRGAIDKVAPSALQRATIPLSRVRGNIKLLPIVNQVTTPDLVNGGEQTLAGFHRIESMETVDDPASVQLLALWQDKGVIPSLELLTLMAQYAVLPQDIIIHCGREIQLGTDGPLIPIDEFGRAELPATDENTSLQTIYAEDLLSRETQSAEQETVQEKILKQSDIPIIQATGEQVKSINGISRVRLESTLQASSQLYVEENVYQLSRIPTWAEIAILFDLTIILYLIMSLRAPAVYFSFVIILITIFVCLMLFIHSLQYWFALKSPLIILAFCWIFSLQRNRLKKV
ncbi:MAG: hypothetical protein ACSHX0_12555 [Akkermansiaceae bacterium]